MDWTTGFVCAIILIVAIITYRPIKIRVQKYRLETFESKLRQMVINAIRNEGSMNKVMANRLVYEVKSSNMKKMKVICAGNDEEGNCIMPTDLWNVLCWLAMRNCKTVEYTVRLLEHDHNDHLVSGDRLKLLTAKKTHTDETTSAIITLTDIRTRNKFERIFREMKRYVQFRKNFR